MPANSIAQVLGCMHLVLCAGVAPAVAPLQEFGLLAWEVQAM
jgi:hypothetical protein